MRTAACSPRCRRATTRSLRHSPPPAPRAPSPAIADPTVRHHHGGNHRHRLSTLVTVTAESTVQLDAFDEGITSSVAYGAASAVDNGVTCPGTSSSLCAAIGNGTSGASASWGGTGSNWSSTSFSGNLKASTRSLAQRAARRPAWGWDNTGVGAPGSSAPPPRTSGRPQRHGPPPRRGDRHHPGRLPSANGCYALGTTSARRRAAGRSRGPGARSLDDNGWCGPPVDCVHRPVLRRLPPPLRHRPAR